MASRPVYIPKYTGNHYVDVVMVDFDWSPGMAVSQKQKSINSLHENAISNGYCKNPLEVSSKSVNELGVNLSAFNLKVTTQKHKNEFTVETAFQSSKVFEHGGPFKDLLYATSIQAKKDERIKSSGRLLKFMFFNEEWELEPKTAFYDWVYLNALNKNRMLVDELSSYDAFTDIEFNPNKSINCQAYSVALYKALDGRQLLDDALADKESYLDIIESALTVNAYEDTKSQPKLI
jgi:hypothetical protein